MYSRTALALLALWAALLGGCGEGAAPPPPAARPEPAAPSAPAPGPAAAVYAQSCAPCHGADGKGKGPAATALPVQPRDFTDPVVMGQRSDGDLFKIIKEGGQGVGKSPAMPPWGSTLSDAEIRALVAHVRAFSARR
jgi:mono/diheme cytochrome c family protein